MDKYQQVSHDWLQCMEGIGRKELACFEEYSVGYTEQIVTMNCRRSIMVWVYSTLVGARKIMPIERLDVEVKKQMWAFVLEVCNGKEYDKKRMLEIAKTFYIIEYFIKEQQNNG
jgi:hypothetical protein